MAQVELTDGLQSTLNRRLRAVHCMVLGRGLGESVWTHEVVPEGLA